jgi:hypothetical protein
MGSSSTCRAGHPRTAGNTRRDGRGVARCVICARRHSRLWRARRQKHTAGQRVAQNKRDTPWACITWCLDLHNDPQACWTYHRTRADAESAAPTDGQPFTIVDVAVASTLRRPRIDELVARTRREPTQPDHHDNNGHPKSRWSTLST